MDQLFVTNAMGESEEFSEGKVRRSIKRLGIPGELEEDVVDHVKSILYPKIMTQEIYEHIREYLNRSQPHAAVRYNLKSSILELGPSGYSFESYISLLLKAHGYETKTQVNLEGRCVSHEVDVLAEKDGKRFMLECKYHNLWGARSDIKVALYIKSRFEDLKDTHNLNQGWLVTNTKCTTDALQYASCCGLKIISWGYPETGNLVDLIESVKLYPITCSLTLTSQQKNYLLRKNIALSRDLLDTDEQIFIEAGLDTKQIGSLKEEVKQLLES